MLGIDTIRPQYQSLVILEILTFERRELVTVKNRKHVQFCTYYLFCSFPAIKIVSVSLSFYAVCVLSSVSFQLILASISKLLLTYHCINVQWDDSAQIVDTSDLGNFIEMYKKKINNFSGKARSAVRIFQLFHKCAKKDDSSKPV